MNIKGMRVRSGLTQQEVADAMGISRTRFGNWENEYREINFKEACMLADVLECTLDELAGRETQQQDQYELSDDEQDIVAAYRNTNSQGRETIETIARIQRGA